MTGYSTHPAGHSSPFVEAKADYSLYNGQQLHPVLSLVKPASELALHVFNWRQCFLAILSAAITICASSFLSLLVVTTES